MRDTPTAQSGSGDVPANEEMVAGYRDGFDLSNPAPSSNRTASYRHGFMCARIDKRELQWSGTADDLRMMADEAMSLDKLLSGITEENLHGEVQTGPAVGNEED